MSALTLHDRLAAYYTLDARQFYERYVLAGTVSTDTSWRIKCFVDLLMSAECALKAHICNLSKAEDPKTLIRRLRHELKHDISKLADHAVTLQPSAELIDVRDLLGKKHFDVSIRYSLDAEQSFFVVAPLVIGDGLTWGSIAAASVKALLDTLPAAAGLPEDWDERVKFERELYLVYSDARKKSKPALGKSPP